MPAKPHSSMPAVRGPPAHDVPAAFITIDGIELCQAAKGGAVSKSAA